MTRRAIGAWLAALCGCRKKSEHRMYNDQSIASMDSVPGSLLIGTTTEPFLGEGKRQLVIRGRGEEHLVFTLDLPMAEAKLFDVDGRAVAHVIAGNVAVWGQPQAVRARIAVARKRLIEVRPLVSDNHLPWVNKALSILVRIEEAMQAMEGVMR